MTTHIPYYLDYLSKTLLQAQEAHTLPVEQVEGLRIGKGLRERFASIETTEALTFLVDLYTSTHADLRSVLDKRRIDRAFIDQQTTQCTERNKGRSYLSVDYESVIGKLDTDGRLVVGPHANSVAPPNIQLPDFLQGEHVTLFGPPDTAKMTINAMNALHRTLPNEAPIVEELVTESKQVPRWGADNEDSKTPVINNLLSATENLMGCFRGTLEFTDSTTGKQYRLEKDGLAKPIKRIPGLALPDGNHLYQGNPLPLHMVDFAFHLFHNWQYPEALVFYIPKLENEEEAGYLKTLISLAEEKIKALHPEYQLGSVKLFIVFENPRSIFRIREIATTLAPHFVGGSLGWHDFLASTARLFRNDPNYRIPVKADPNIVIKHIRESHHILVDSLGADGGVKIGGMYGILYEEGNADSFDVCMVGYIKDVITQLKRQLNGFWVAHPNFVRVGIAIVQAYRCFEKDPQDTSLHELVCVLVKSPSEQKPLIDFVFGEDAPGLSKDHPLYLRGVLAADIEVSDVIPNHHPDEVRYNIFQAIQYLTDWLCGNGCVALPAALQNASGEKVFVRIMDDLATTERSRWELWAEIKHERVSIKFFEQLLDEEINFIQNDESTPTKRVQVAWAGEAARWYPVAIKVLRQLVFDPNPVEFATELLMPFTLGLVRDHDDPWQVASKLCPERYRAF
jgi:malate synthase